MRNQSVFLICFVFLAGFFFWPGGEAFASKAGKADKRIEAERAELERLKRTISQERDKLLHLEAQERSVLFKVNGISRKLDLKKRELKLLDRELALNKKQIIEYERKLKEMDAAAESRERVLSTRVRALYKEGNFSYLKVIFSSEGLSDLTRRVTYIRIIAEADAELFKKMIETGEKTRRIRNALLSSQEKLVSLRGDILKKKSEYQEKRRARSRFLESVQKEKSLYENSVKELEAASRSVANLISRLETKRAVGAASVELEGLWMNLPWPVSGRVISRYGKKYNARYKIAIFNPGIVIRSRSLESIRAVSTGKVLYADWLKGYGRLLIIGHGKGYHSLYGYLDNFLVGVGDIVRQGDIIAEAGETGHVNGPSLYFEIRRKGRPVDPFKWLSPKRVAAGR